MAQEVVNGLTDGLSLWDRTVLTVRYAWRQHRWRLAGTVVSFIAAIFFAALGFGSPGNNPQGIFAAGGFLAFALLMWRQARAAFAHPLAGKLQTYLRLPSFGEHLGKIPVMAREVKELCRLCLEDEHRAKRLVFMIDDLDRCGVKGVVKTLEAVRLAMDLPNVTVIVAVDHRMALAALTHHYHELAEKGSHRTAHAIARDYLGKIFHLPIRLSEPGKESLEGYVNDVLFDHVAKRGREAGEVSALPQQGLSDGVSTGVEEANYIQPPGGRKMPSETGPEIKPPTPTKRSETGLIQNTAVLAESARDTAEPRNESSPPEAEETAPMQDTQGERAHFMKLAELLHIHNPRELKRLHNSYRLLKALSFHRERMPGIPYKIDEAKNLQLMAVLFWLEHLYVRDKHRQVHEVNCMKSGRWLALPGKKEGEARDEASLTDDAYGWLYKELAFGDSDDNLWYQELKRLADPFMLPFADVREDEQGKKESDGPKTEESAQKES